MNPFLYTLDNKRYHTLNYFYHQTFDSKVFKISLNGGFSCPNLDGTKGYGGCIYCSKSGSGDFAGKEQDDISLQWQQGLEMMHKKWPDGKLIAYFQARTNTYAPVETLKEKFEPVLKYPNVIGLAIATRPDAITEECLDYLDDLNKRTYLIVELGLQTIHEKTGKLIWECPQCHNRDQNKMSVARRTCGYIGTNFWNQGRTQEIQERVLHIDDKVFNDGE